MSYVQDAITSLRDYFKAEIPNRVTTAVAEYNTGKSPSDVDYLRVPNDSTKYNLGELFELKLPFHMFFYPDFVTPIRSGQRNKLVTVDCFVGVRIKGTGDLPKDYLGAYIYLDVMWDAIEDDATLGGRVNACILQSGDCGQLPEGDQSENAVGALLKVSIHVQGDRS